MTLVRGFGWLELVLKDKRVVSAGTPVMKAGDGMENTVPVSDNVCNNWPVTTSLTTRRRHNLQLIAPAGGWARPGPSMHCLQTDRLTAPQSYLETSGLDIGMTDCDNHNHSKHFNSHSYSLLRLR